MYATKEAIEKELYREMSSEDGGIVLYKPQSFQSSLAGRL